MATQSARSTNWKSAVFGSNSNHSTSDSPKSISDVHSAMLRALRATTSSSPRVIRMKAAPTSGKKVTSERSGQWLTAAFLRSSREQVPGHDRDEPDHHREGIVIEVAGLQSARLARQVAGHRGNPVRTEPVDDRTVAGFPQPIAEHKRCSHEDPIIQLVEVPFVQQEQVKRAELRSQTHREPRIGDVEGVGDGDADQGEDQWHVANEQRDTFSNRE